MSDENATAGEEGDAATPPRTPVRRRTKAEDVIISASAMRETKERIREWTRREEQEREAAHQRVRKEYEDSSNRMLRVVVALWVVIVVGIGWQVWSSISLSRLGSV